MKMMLTAVTALLIAVSPLAAQTNSSNPSAVNFVDQQNKSEVLGSDFIGTAVTTKDGQQIGKIADLVFDQNGRIELAVIGVGGFLGIGEKDVAVPFDNVKSAVINNKHVFVIDSTKEQLQTAPAFKTLDRLAFNQRMADWRAKASESWAEIKSRAAKVYDDAKARVNEARQPSEQPK